ncbi:MAG: hypothetical protein ACERKV_12835 [Clostridiaceae bacterium]
MRKLKDLFILLFFLAIVIFYLFYTWPKLVDINYNSSLFISDSNEYIENVNISIQGEISKKFVKDGLFKGSIKVADDEYNDVMIYLKKNSKADIYYKENDNYIKLGTILQEGYFEQFTIVMEKGDLISAPCETKEEGKNLYIYLKDKYNKK